MCPAQEEAATCFPNSDTRKPRPQPSFPGKVSDSEQSAGVESFILASFQFPLEITNDLKSEL